MTSNDTFGSRLTQARVELGLSQAELAERTGIAPAQISRYESGRNIPRAGVVVKLAKALDVSSQWLITGTFPFDRQLGPPITIQLPEHLHHTLAERAEVRGQSVAVEAAEQIERMCSISQSRLVKERRKLELVALYAAWCKQHSSPPLKSFGAFAAAYKASEDDMEGELDTVSGIESVDTQYLSELYSTWIMERQIRFPDLIDNPPPRPFEKPTEDFTARAISSLTAALCRQLLETDRENKAGLNKDEKEQALKFLNFIVHSPNIDVSSMPGLVDLVGKVTARLK